MIVGERVEWQQVDSKTGAKDPRSGVVAAVARGGTPSEFTLLVAMPDGQLVERGAKYTTLQSGAMVREQRAISRLGEAMAKVAPEESRREGEHAVDWAARYLGEMAAEMIAIDDDRTKLRADAERLEALVKELRAKIKKAPGAAGPGKGEEVLP